MASFARNYYVGLISPPRSFECGRASKARQGCQDAHYSLSALKEGPRRFIARIARRGVVLASRRDPPGLAANQRNNLGGLSIGTLKFKLSGVPQTGEDSHQRAKLFRLGSFRSRTLPSRLISSEYPRSVKSDSGRRRNVPHHRNSNAAPNGRGADIFAFPRTVRRDWEPKARPQSDRELSSHSPRRDGIRRGASKLKLVPLQDALAGSYPDDGASLSYWRTDTQMKFQPMEAAATVRLIKSASFAASEQACLLGYCPISCCDTLTLPLLGPPPLTAKKTTIISLYMRAGERFCMALSIIP